MTKVIIMHNFIVKKNEICQKDTNTERVRKSIGCYPHYTLQLGGLCISQRTIDYVLTPFFFYSLGHQKQPLLMKNGPKTNLSINMFHIKS